MKIIILGQIILQSNSSITYDKELLTLINSADLVISNVDNALNHPLVGEETRKDKKFSHVISPDILNIIPGKKKIFVLGNNHVYDYGLAGIENWKLYCETNKQYLVGIKPYLFIDIDNIRIFSIASDNIPNDYTYKANSDTYSLIEKNIKTNGFNILFLHDHTNLGFESLKGIDCYIRTGEPYQEDYKLTQSYIFNNLGCFIFDTKVPENYRKEAWNSWLIELALDNENSNVNLFELS
jgi:hypothetical protein